MRIVSIVRLSRQQQRPRLPNAIGQGASSYAFIPLLLRGSCHFALSRAVPGAQALVRQLDAGLARLQDSGAVRRVLERSGVVEPRVAHWQLVGYN
jgi:hypothetical protein